MYGDSGGFECGLYEVEECKGRLGRGASVRAP